MHTRPIKKPSGIKKAVLVFFAILFLIIFVLGGTIASYKLVNEYTARKGYRKMNDDFTGTEMHVEYIGPLEDTPDLQELPMTVDMQEVCKENPDTAGWLYIPCLDISYPLMYSGDNDYYLHRNFEKEYAFAGSLFIDMYSDPHFTGANTVVYGHNMIDESMFGKLWWIPYKNAAASDPYFWIYTPGAVYRYKIFSAFGSDIYSEGFKQFRSHTTEFIEWAYRMLGQSYLEKEERTFSADDRIVTLTTCGENSYYRTLVMGVLDKTYQTEQFETTLPERVPDGTVIQEVEWNFWDILKDKQLYIHLAVFSFIALLLAWLISKKRNHRKGKNRTC